MLTKENVENACCVSCRYFRSESSDYGRCHFNAPQPEKPKYYPFGTGPSDSWTPYIDWPIVMHEDVCGKFIEK